MKTRQKRRATPKQLRAIQASRHLRVLHHRHTGHVTHRRTTSYPTLFMIVLCVGVFLACWTRFVSADPFVFPGPVTNSYQVYARVPGPPPAVAATIDTPESGAVFTDIPIDVGGSCPTGTYVVLYRNGAFSGVSLCQPDSTWTLQTGLFEGVNKLEARVFSLTDVPGPMSGPVSVTYNPPQSSTSGGSNGSNSGNTGSPSGGGTTRGSSSSPVSVPLIFKTVFRYQGYYTGQSTGWELDLEGGQSPYAVSVDWGDGQHQLISRPTAGVFQLQHTYKKAGQYKGSYVVTFAASDAAGHQTFLQLVAIVNDPPAAAASSKPRNPLANSPSYIKNLWQYVWPSYAVVVLMLFSFWLGERREYYYLKPSLRKRRHA